jgi:hypothetical protein
MVNVRDITHSPQDVFIKNLITVDSGIMSGDFTQDHTKLIVGEVNGSINVLEVGNQDRGLKDMERLVYLEYDWSLASRESPQNQENEDDKAVADDMLATGEMVVVPFGGFPVRQAVQGPNYRGPWMDEEMNVDAPALREQALEFQLSLMKDEGGPKCGVRGCDDVVKVTSEEIGDSGRSTDRIPDELRRQWTMLDSKPIPGKTKCSECGRPARPSEDAEALCERCDFKCFRCGGTCSINAETTFLYCERCGRQWDAGALGYDVVPDRNGQDSLRGFGLALACYGEHVDLRNGKWESLRFEHNDASFGDEMNALTDHYLSLGICE